MTNWKEYKLGELLGKKGYIRGPFGSALKRPEMKLQGFAVYEQQHAIYNTREFRYFIDDSKFAELHRFSIRPNDLIISCSGTVGQISIIKEGDPIGIISQALLTLRPNLALVTPAFLYYFFKTKTGHNQLLSASHGSVQVNIAKRAIVESIPISVPCIEKQREITEILSSLDDKIELNNKINQELETLAQTLFKQWFIDFEFPNENGEPYKSSGGEMIDSELGEIPKGWQVVQLEQLCDRMNSGGTPSTRRDDYYNGSIFWYSTKELQDSFLFSSDRTISDKGLANSSAKIFPVNTVVMAIYAAPTVGRLGILSQDAAFNQAALGFVAKSEIGYEYIFLLLKHLRSDLNNLANGAAQQNLNVRIVKNYPTFLATRNLLKCFQEVISPIFTMMKNNQVENIELKTLRDTLLPKLISGELRVSELTAQNA